MRLELREGLPPDRAAWSRLAELSANVFATPEWAETWWETLGRRERPLTVLARDGTSLAVLGLSTGRPLRTLRFAGHGPADELGPVGGEEARRACAAALPRILREHDACDVLLGEQLPGELALAGAVGIGHIPSPVLRFEHRSWEELLASRSSKLRAKVRGEERALHREGATIRLVDDPDGLDAAFSALVAMHGERWGPSSGFLTGGAEPFHRAFARVALERGWLRLWVLEMRGRVEAVWHGFRFGGCDAHYQSGRFASCPRGGGSVLLAHALRAALEDGMRELRFLRGGEEYKLRWANGDRSLQSVAVGVTARGRAAAAVAGLADARRGVTLGRVARRALLV